MSMPLTGEANANIDGALKGMINGIAPYGYRMVQPYLEANNYRIKDPDAIACMIAFEKTIKKLNWDFGKSQLNDAIITLAVLLETDNAWRQFTKEFCHEFVKAESDDRAISEYYQREHKENPQSRFL